MTPFATPDSRLAGWSLEAIHLANKAYWGSKELSHEADMEHQLRQERLERIRREIDELEMRNRSSA
jgi:ribosomal protein L32